MNVAARLSLATLALFMLVACGGASAPDADQVAEEEEAAAAELGRDTDDTALDDMIQTQDRARAVEGVSMGHKQDIDAAIESSSGDPADEAGE